VVGSRYFWSVFALAVLLIGVAMYWRAIGRPLPHSTIGAARAPLPDAEPDYALTEAQRTERELRARLESLLVQLTERRGQCPLPTSSNLPDSSDATVTSPTIREPNHTAILPIAPVKPPGSNTGSNASERPAVAPSPAGVDSSGRVQLSPEVANLDFAPAQAEHETLLSARSTHSADSAPKPPQLRVSPGVATAPLPLTPPSQPPSTAEALDRSLQQALAAPEPTSALPPKRQPSLAPLVKADPTPEERREFANRMSATGAATGEITATLLWNSPGDLDLVVRCPSGQPLDYRNSSGCGGTLDVDANAARTSLSQRPVENAFWSAGKAPPGHYEIAVRYAPRKDEQNPGETPFQVRLSRGGQESVFKGVIRPNTLTPVTTFTVER
jgi:hypothetical protein